VAPAKATRRATILRIRAAAVRAGGVVQVTDISFRSVFALVVVSLATSHQLMTGM